MQLINYTAGFRKRWIFILDPNIILVNFKKNHLPNPLPANASFDRISIRYIIFNCILWKLKKKNWEDFPNLFFYSELFAKPSTVQMYRSWSWNLHKCHQYIHHYTGDKLCSEWRNTKRIYTQITMSRCGRHMQGYQFLHGFIGLTLCLWYNESSFWKKNETTKHLLWAFKEFADVWNLHWWPVEVCGRNK